MINSIIQSGRAQGMISMDDSLMALHTAGIVSDAYAKATEKASFEALLDSPRAN